MNPMKEVVDGLTQEYASLDDGFDMTASQYHSLSGAALHAQYYALRGSKQQSGFEDVEPVKGAPYTCGSFEHNPPMGLYVPVGRRYRHVCPQCGMTQYINSMEVYC